MSDEASGAEWELIAGRLIEAASGNSTLIACFFTGPSRPAFVAPMPRNPSPPIGLAFDETFADAYHRALRANPSLHDGALLLGRATATAPYQLQGWSMRLFPPETGGQTDFNMGSAFNSCFAMSFVTGIDRVLLVKSHEHVSFVTGQVLKPPHT